MDATQLSSMFDLFPIGCYRSSPEGRMLRANRALLQLNGYDSEQELLRHFNDVARQWYVDPARREVFLACVERDGHVLDFVSEIYRHKTRERIWVKENAHLVRDADGQALFFEGTVEDITESRNTRLALQKSESLLRQVTSQVPGMVYCIAFAPGESGRYTFVSAGVRQLFGLSQEQVLADAGRLRSMRHPQDRPWVAQQVSEAIAQRQDLSIEFRIVLPDGKLKWVEMASSAAPDVGDTRMRAGVLIDISSRKLAQAALHQRERFLETLTNSLTSRIAYWDADCRCRFANASYHNWFGRTEQQMQGIALQELMDPELYALNRPHVEAVLQGQNQRFERKVHLHDGTPAYVIVEYIADFTPRGVQGYVVLVSDVTEIKSRQLEEEQLNHELQRATALANEASLAKSRFLANMSHEIRTPMNAILGMLSLLQKTELAGPQVDYVHKAKSASHSLLGLLNDILDLSKVEAGKMQLDPQPFSLEQMLRDMSVLLSSYQSSTAVELLFDVDSSVPDCLLLDAPRLQQVLINLASNAIKFTPQGEVVLRIRAGERSASGLALEFCVQDSGIGIAAEVQARLFTEFTQAESSTTRSYGGTGLGLAISQRLVQLMGGQIVLHSTLGLGSAFSFVLSAALPLDVPEALRPRPAPGPERRTALVVDDNQRSAALMAQALTAQGWPVQIAHSGAEALACMQAQLSPERFPFEVVYLDWHMPGMDGWELARGIQQLGQQCSGAPALLVMVTGQARAQLSHRTPQEQAWLNAFLVKPVTPGMLREAALRGEANRFHIRQTQRSAAGQRRLLGMRILVVEDNLINQQVAEELLLAEGALVSLAANGRLGVEAVAAAAPQFDVVLMDLQMPVLDGYAATREIRHELQLTRLPIVAMTANAMASDRDACLGAGMNEHIGKPFDLTRLVELLLRITGFASSAPARQTASGPDLALPEVPGLELATALARMSGMRALYLRTALDFMAMLDGLVSDLRLALAAGEHAQCKMRLHTLKGNAATLGAMDLSLHAARLERWLNVGTSSAECSQGLDTLEQLAQATQILLQQAIDQLRTTEIASSPAPAPLDAPAMLALLGELKALLQQSDMQALHSFASVRDQLLHLPVEFMEGLDNAMQNLSFDSAHALCQAMMEQLSARLARSGDPQAQ